MCGSSSSLRPIYTGLVSAVVLTVVLAQTCERVDPEMFPSCVNIGHNQTFKIPSYVDKNRMSAYVKKTIKRRSKCLIAESVATAVTCAVFVPLCVEGRKTPLFLCHRVCAEYALGCSDKEYQRSPEYYGAMCNLLPNKTAASKECFEPENFKMTVNQDDFPLLGKCHKRVIPMCGDQGFDNTIYSIQAQAEIFRHLFNRTLDIASLNTSDYSLSPSDEKELKTYSTKCAAALRRMFCVRYLPPCHPGKPKQFYGLCKSDCRILTEYCPDFFRRYPEDYEYCADFPDGEKFNGLCAHTTWPRTVSFGFSRRTSPVPPTEKTKPNPGVIAAAVIVPVVLLVIVAVAAVFIVRRYNVKKMAYMIQQDKKQDHEL